MVTCLLLATNVPFLSAGLVMSMNARMATRHALSARQDTSATKVVISHSDPHCG